MSPPVLTEASISPVEASDVSAFVVSAAESSEAFVVSAFDSDVDELESSPQLARAVAAIARVATNAKVFLSVFIRIFLLKVYIIFFQYNMYERLIFPAVFSICSNMVNVLADAEFLYSAAGCVLVDYYLRLMAFVIIEAIQESISVPVYVYYRSTAFVYKIYRIFVSKSMFCIVL